MPTLVDRHAELRALNDRRARTSSFALVYGQRRTGKTFLLQHALEGSPDLVYFMADESTAASLLARLWADLGAAGRAPVATVPADWATALTLVAQQATLEGRPLTLVLDECQYLIDAEPALPSVLQRIWDQHRHRMPLHLVLCGSALGTLERLGDVAQPLHGRFDLKLKLRAFDYANAAGFVPGWPRGDQLRLYGVFGGLARHLAEVDPARSLADNVQRAILDPHAPLHDAAPELLRSERLSSRAEADAVLAAVAAGENTFGAIAARAGISGNRADYVIKELLELEILERVGRWGDREGSRYTRYRCADPFTRFWFRFVAPNRSALNSAGPERVWSERVAPRLDDHMGAIFEMVARQAALAGVLGPRLGSIDEAAPWWSRDGRTEIDLILRAGRDVLAVECKWRGQGEVDLRALRQLRDHVSRQPSLGGDPDVRLCLFSAGGFAPALRQVAEAEGILLVGPEVLLPARAA